MPQVNKALATLKANGQYDAIYTKWFGKQPEPAGIRGPAHGAGLTRIRWQGEDCGFRLVGNRDGIAQSA